MTTGRGRFRAAGSAIRPRAVRAGSTLGRTVDHWKSCLSADPVRPRDHGREAAVAEATDGRIQQEPRNLLQKCQQRCRWSPLDVDTAPTWAVAPTEGQIFAILGAFDCRFRGPREPTDFFNRLLGAFRICSTPWRHRRESGWWSLADGAWRNPIQVQHLVDLSQLWAIEHFVGHLEPNRNDPRWRRNEDYPVALAPAQQQAASLNWRPVSRRQYIVVVSDAAAGNGSFTDATHGETMLASLLLPILKS